MAVGRADHRRSGPSSLLRFQVIHWALNASDAPAHADVQLLHLFVRHACPFRLGLLLSSESDSRRRVNSNVRRLPASAVAFNISVVRTKWANPFLLDLSF